MGEDLELYKPTDIELEKNIRYLRSIGLPNIGITVRGDIYNKITNKYSADRPNYVFSIDGKPHGYTKLSLLKHAFKFDPEDPSKILDLKNKDDIAEVYLTWDFYHNQKSYLLTDFRSASDFLKKLPKSVSMNLRYNSLGLYNIKIDKYYTVGKNGYYNVAYTHNSKKHKAFISSEKLLNEFKYIGETNNPVAPMINNEVDNDTTDIIQVKKLKRITKQSNDNTKTLKVNIDMKKQDKIQETNESHINKMAVLEFINDVLTMDLDLVAEKYKVSKEILKVIKK